MKYYSELTKKLYNTQKELDDAENILKEKERDSEERKKRAFEVEEARKAMNAAASDYQKKLNSFLKDFGSFHWTEKEEFTIPSLFNLIGIL